MIFDEKQYLGYNKSSLSLRIAISLFCFILAWFSDSEAINENLLFLLGIVILAVSALLLFVTHLHTQVTEDRIILTRILGTARVEIKISDIESCRVTSYSNYLIDYPAYNLHGKDSIRFYTGGNDAVRLKMESGPDYIIGSRKSDQFAATLQKLIEVNK